MGAHDGSLIGRTGAAGRIGLDAVGSGVAIPRAARASIADIIPKLARDPEVYALVIDAAGPTSVVADSDVAEILALHRADPVEARRALEDRYGLCWLLDCFSKPTVSLIDGPITGDRAGLTLWSTHRVAGPGYRLSLSQTAVGFFPDQGIAHALARLPGGIGTYLALTGRSIGRADALRLGLVTHCIRSEDVPRIETALAAADPVDPVLDDLHADPGPGDLLDAEETIARVFSAPDLSAIHDRLLAETGARRTWAEAVTADLQRRSPTAMAATVSHIRAAAHRALQATLEADLVLALEFLEHPDLTEGTRAPGADHAPRWTPPSIAALRSDPPARLLATIGPLATGASATGATTWRLPTRAQMQSLRV